MPRCSGQGGVAAAKAAVRSTTESDKSAPTRGTMCLPGASVGAGSCGSAKETRRTIADRGDADDELEVAAHKVFSSPASSGGATRAMLLADLWISIQRIRMFCAV